MYVGSSIYPSKRVFIHEHCQGKDFSAVWFLPVDEGERETTERHWIRTLTPVHNKAGNPSADSAFPGWGADPAAESAFMVKLPGQFRDLLADIRGRTGCPYTTITQMALEHWALSTRIRIKPKWAHAIITYTAPRPADFTDGGGI